MKKIFLKIMVIIIIFYIFINCLVVNSLRENWSLPINYFTPIVDFELAIGRDPSYGIAFKLSKNSYQNLISNCEKYGYKDNLIKYTYEDVNMYGEVDIWAMKYRIKNNSECLKAKDTTEINDLAYVSIVDGYVIFVYHEF